MTTATETHESTQAMIEQAVDAPQDACHPLFSKSR